MKLLTVWGESSMNETVAVLGTGKTGTALARAFAVAGHGVVAWKRTPARAGHCGA